MSEPIRCERCGLAEAEGRHEPGDVLIVRDDCGHEEDSCYGCLADRRAAGECLSIIAGGVGWLNPDCHGRRFPLEED